MDKIIYMLTNPYFWDGVQSICLGFLVIGGLTYGAMYLDYRAKKKAKDNGCVCNLDGAIVQFIRSDCTYHG